MSFDRTKLEIKHSLCHQEPVGCIHEDGCEDGCRVYDAICAALGDQKAQLKAAREEGIREALEIIDANPIECCFEIRDYIESLLEKDEQK